MTVYKDVRTTEHEAGQGQRVATFKLTQLVWLMVGLIEAVLALRVVFKLIGVNAANPFAALIYSVSTPFVAPFASLTGAPAAGGMVLEITSLIAMLVYALIGWGIARILSVLFYRPRGPVSVRQTTVSEKIPQETPEIGSQTTTITEAK
jgi:uncharacterized protein YggT (Ycf19 family)